MKTNKKLVRPKYNNKMKPEVHKRQTQSPFCTGQLLLDSLCTKLNSISFRMRASVFLRHIGLSSFVCFSFIAVVFLPGLGNIVILTLQNKFRSIRPISTLLNNLRMIGCVSLKVWQSSVVNPSGPGCFLVKRLSITEFPVLLWICLDYLPVIGLSLVAWKFIHFIQIFQLNKVQVFFKYSLVTF